MVCGSFSDVLREAWAIRAHCQRDPAYADCEFFFRGEYQSHHPSGDKSLPSLPGNAIASIFRPWNQTLLENEHIMLNEAVRWYPNFVSPDLPTLELLSRMLELPHLKDNRSTLGFVLRPRNKSTQYRCVSLKVL